MGSGVTIRGWFGFLGCSAALAACGVPAPKQAGGCPDGTVLTNGSCVPPDNGGGGGSGGNAGGGGAGSGGNGGGSGGPSDTPPDRGSGVPYDKDLIDSLLKRGAQIVKANCGGAVDDTGKASGPWGSLHVSVKLGHNGHVREVVVPSPYDGKPTGKCIANALGNFIYPPFPGGDIPIDVEVELVQPKK
jgi:hypothetical protein